VTAVSWHEAAAYCAWAGVRLPSHQHWEQAACGPEGREYPWGNEAPDEKRANFGKKARTYFRHSVGLTKRSQQERGDGSFEV
jgi:formylglycine-generating enzyme required for sulfatase activity